MDFIGKSAEESTLKKELICFLILFMAIIIAPAASATEIFDGSLSDPGVYFGTGNPNYGFTILNTVNSDGSPMQMALAANIRYGGPVTPTSNDYVVPTGGGPYALWDFIFSVNTGTDPLSAYTYNIGIVNDTTGATYSFNPILLPDNAQVGADACSNNHIGCAYNGANSGMQNAENLGFSFLSGPLGFDPNAADNYTITLSALPVNGSNVDPSVSINVMAEAPTPEPMTQGMVGAGLVGLGLIGGKRRLQRRA